jgi:ABC-type transport system substrate-binding protein
MNRSLPASILLALALATGLSSQAAAQQKVLRQAFLIAETGFDPAQINDLYSSTILAHIFDPPLTYDYLARPAKVIANTTELPEISADGLTWTLRVKPGIYFADDPAFKGAKRELTAADYVYSLKRHFDVRTKSPNLYLVDRLIVGMDALQAEAKQTGRFNYDREVEGLRALDRYTYQMKFTKPQPNFIYYLTYCNLTCAVAREVVEAYGDKIMAHPVGTNAFRLVDWRRSSRMVLERNPNYRENVYLPQPAADDADAQRIAQKLRGRKLPMIDRVEVYVIEESQPRYLAFLNGEHDLITGVPADFISAAVPNGKLAPNLASRNIWMHRFVENDLTFGFTNMDHPLVGGYTADKVALRRAIGLAFDIDALVLQIYRSQAVRAQNTVPPNAIGDLTEFSSPLAEYSPAKAKALLDTFGYTDRNGDGYRELPDGGPLLLEIASPPDGQSRITDEIWRRSLDAVGLRVTFRKAKWPELLRDSRANKLMMWNLGWTAAIPDAEPFYVILYGPNKGQANHSRFDLPAWNALYDKAIVLPDSPERRALYEQMDKLLAAYAPIRPWVHRITTGLMHPWLEGYQKHPVMRQWWQFVDIDPVLQAAARE